MSDWNQQVIKEFRANNGKVGGDFEGRPLLLLHTTGAKSGLERVTPVMYVKDKDRYAVIASYGGAPTHPDWYFNIVANPEVSIEVGSEHINTTATIAKEPERSRLYEKMAKDYPFFNKYQEKTDRTIPVVILTPHA